LINTVNRLFFRYLWNSLFCPYGFLWQSF